MFELSKPNAALMPSYIECLHEGTFFSMQLSFARASVEEVESDPAAYLTRLLDKQPFVYAFRGKDYTITEHELLWLHDGDRFLGTVALRYDGDQELLMNWGGHIGMAIRPALLQRGYGPRGLRAVGALVLARFLQRGLKSIRVACHPENRPSRHLIESFGAKRLRQDADWLLFEVDLEQAANS